ncbi:MAG TPA: hypothetical protein DCO86_00200 [Spirochaetaceae bacterium]|nr:hypothetical protein [Spirochaetaceae bacterium]
MRLRRRAFRTNARANTADKGAERESPDGGAGKPEKALSRATQALSIPAPAADGSAADCITISTQPHGHGRSDYIPQK